ncbi:MAG TPA: hypothetical protein PKA48_13590, partial [Candidatus Obscuribacter sp.]|nr:hypothetical protein [Candidatus Obscuribacter sp.]
MTNLQTVSDHDHSPAAMVLTTALNIEELRAALEERTDFEGGSSATGLNELRRGLCGGQEWYLRAYEEGGKFFLFRQELQVDRLVKDYLCSLACLRVYRQGDETVMEVSYDVGPEGQAWISGCLLILSLVGVFALFLLLQSGGLSGLFSPPFIIFLLVSFLIYTSTRYFVRTLTENDTETRRA